MKFSEILDLIGTAFRDRGSAALAQRGPTRAREVREVLSAMMAGGNAARNTYKIVRTMDRTDPQWYQGVDSLEDLDPDTMCIGCTALVFFSEAGYGREYELGYDANGPLRVFQDASFQLGDTPAKWTLKDSPEAGLGEIRQFNPFDPDGYETDELIQYTENGVLQFTKARHPFALANYPQGYPQPMAVQTADWQPVSPPNPAFQPFVTISYAAAQDANSNEGVVPGKLYRIQRYAEPEPGELTPTRATVDVLVTGVSYTQFSIPAHSLHNTTGEIVAGTYDLNTDVFTEDAPLFGLRELVVLPYNANRGEEPREFSFIEDALEYVAQGDYGCISCQRGIYTFERQPEPGDAYYLFRGNGATIQIYGYVFHAACEQLADTNFNGGIVQYDKGSLLRYVNGACFETKFEPGEFGQIELSFVKIEGGSVNAPFVYTLGPGVVRLLPGTVIGPHCVPDPLTEIEDLRGAGPDNDLEERVTNTEERITSLEASPFPTVLARALSGEISYRGNNLADALASTGLFGDVSLFLKPIVSRNATLAAGTYVHGNDYIVELGGYTLFHREASRVLGLILQNGTVEAAVQGVFGGPSLFSGGLSQNVQHRARPGCTVRIENRDFIDNGSFIRFAGGGTFILSGTTPDPQPAQIEAGTTVVRESGTTNPGSGTGVDPQGITTKKVSTGETSLTLEQTGDGAGGSRLELLSRSGSAGARFSAIPGPQNPAGLDLVDFAFVGISGTQKNFRYEHRAAQLQNGANANRGEFQILDNPGTQQEMTTHSFGENAFTSRTNIDLSLVASTGIIMKSPNGTRYKLTVSDAGQPVFTNV